jgi:hypothetical protein
VFQRRQLEMAKESKKITPLPMAPRRQMITGVNDTGD